MKTTILLHLQREVRFVLRMMKHNVEFQHAVVRERAGRQISCANVLNEALAETRVPRPETLEQKRKRAWALHLKKQNRPCVNWPQCSCVARGKNKHCGVYT